MNRAQRRATGYTATKNMPMLVSCPAAGCHGHTRMSSRSFRSLTKRWTECPACGTTKKPVAKQYHGSLGLKNVRGSFYGGGELESRTRMVAPRESIRPVVEPSRPAGLLKRGGAFVKSFFGRSKGKDRNSG